MGYVSAQMHRYFEKCNAILQHTYELPQFFMLDHFLSYCLCPPSIKDWSKSQTLAKALLSFPWLDDFATIVIDLAKDYSLLHSICLQLPPK